MILFLDRSLTPPPHPPLDSALSGASAHQLLGSGYSITTLG